MLLWANEEGAQWEANGVGKARYELRWRRQSSLWTQWQWTLRKFSVIPACELCGTLTANNLAKLLGWPHDPMCPLCNAAPEMGRCIWHHIWEDRTYKHHRQTLSVPGGDVWGAGARLTKTETQIWRAHVIFLVQHLKRTQQKDIPMHLLWSSPSVSTDLDTKLYQDERTVKPSRTPDNIYCLRWTSLVASTYLFFFHVFVLFLSYRCS
jgi:hypothetical protein